MSDGAFDSSATTEISGGEVDFSSATITSVGGILDISSGELELGANSATVAIQASGGQIDGTGTLTAIGPSVFSNVSFTGGVTALVSSTGLAIVSGAVYLDDGSNLLNAGTLNVVSGGAFYLAYSPEEPGDTTGGAIDNTGTFDITAATSFAEEGSGSIENSGTFEQTSTSGTTFVDADFINQGSGNVSIQTGTMDFADGFDSEGLVTLENSTLELAAGATAGTVDFAGTGGHIDVADPAATSLILENFVGGNGIVFSDIAYATGMTATYSDDVLTLYSGPTVEATLGVGDATPIVSGNLIVKSYQGLAEVVQSPCFLRGTRILSARGEVPIETLAIGDRVMTHTGVTQPILWIGRRSFTPWESAGNRAVQPICFAAGCLGDDLPHWDLWVSPEHAMYVDGMLIPASALVNGTSIIQDERVGQITYFHLEFDAHTIIFAEGALAESFVDDDSRQMFDNAADYVRRYPDRYREPARFCAPRVEEGWDLERVRQRLVGRERLPGLYRSL